MNEKEKAGTRPAQLSYLPTANIGDSDGKDTNLSYCGSRLKELSISDEENHFIGVQNGDFRPIPNFVFFQGDKDDNIIINYLTADGNLVEYEDEEKNQGRNIKAYSRTRLKDPKPGQGKYKQPKGTENFPFFTPEAIRCFKKKSCTGGTLYIVEGEFKAFALSKIGLCAIGIGGIYNYSNKEKTKIHTDTAAFISTTQPKNIVILHDADALQLKDFSEDKEATERPAQFCAALTRFFDYLKPIFQGDVYYQHISREAGAKGIDDLLCLQSCDKDKCKAELLAVQKSHTGQYVDCEKITGEAQTKRYFGLTTAPTFYDRYKDDIGEREFTFHGSRYAMDDTGKIKPTFSKLPQRYLMVSSELYKIIVNDMGNKELAPWKISRISAEIPNSKDFIRQIPKYDGFAYEPENDPDKFITECLYSSEGIESKLYNRYYPVSHRPERGECSNILKLLHHIFDYQNNNGDTLFEFALDYIKLLYEKPLQKLPIICLVSRERGTGKTTFLDLLVSIFQSNAVILDNSRIGNKFNSLIEGKLLVCVDESCISKSTVESMKQNSTGKQIPIEGKGKDVRMAKNFLKYILCSNKELDFINIDEEENRYCIIQVPTIKENKDAHLMEKLKLEIPAFLFYLKNRPLYYPEKGRLYFDEAIFRTPALNEVIEASQGTLEKNLRDVIQQQFIWQQRDPVSLSLTVMFNMVRDQYKLADRTEIQRILRKWKKDGKLTVKEKTTFYYCISDDNEISSRDRVYCFKSEDFYKPEN